MLGLYLNLNTVHTHCIEIHRNLHPILKRLRNAAALKMTNRAQRRWMYTRWKNHHAQGNCQFTKGALNNTPGRNPVQWPTEDQNRWGQNRQQKYFNKFSSKQRKIQSYTYNDSKLEACAYIPGLFGCEVCGGREPIQCKLTPSLKQNRTVKFPIVQMDGTKTKK